MFPNNWSPDGHLAFMTVEKRLPFCKSSPPPIIPLHPCVPCAEAQFSPDGIWIAYIGQGGAAGGVGIVVQPVPGRAPTFADMR